MDHKSVDSQMFFGSVCLDCLEGEGYELNICVSLLLQLKTGTWFQGILGLGRGWLV